MFLASSLVLNILFQRLEQVGIRSDAAQSEKLSGTGNNVKKPRFRNVKMRIFPEKYVR